MPYQVIAQLPNGGQKSVLNRSEQDVAALVLEFVRDQTITTKWGSKTQTRQAYEVRVYSTADSYSKKTSGALVDFVKGRQNQYPRFERSARKELEVPARRARVFVVMPILA